MKPLVTLLVMASAWAMFSNGAWAAYPECSVVCSCAMPCSTVCAVLGTSQPVTCELGGFACMESCPDEKLAETAVFDSIRYSENELVCR
jgi:hypothetical protein